jgi:hypothetical protein
VFSGLSRRAAKGRFEWKVTAVFCRSRQVLSAASICGCVRGVRFGGAGADGAGFWVGGEKGM